jgi:hypothetical protein
MKLPALVVVLLLLLLLIVLLLQMQHEVLKLLQAEANCQCMHATHAAGCRVACQLPLCLLPNMHMCPRTNMLSKRMATTRICGAYTYCHRSRPLCSCD